MDKILKLLDENARLTNDQIAVMLGMTAAAVDEAIEKYERDGVICGYKALIDWEKVDREYVVARIELKVSPKRDHGFEEIAKRIAQFHEVESVYLMSGGYDLAVTVSGKTFKEIALFVAQKLSTLDSVLSTATHFVLRKYKERGVSYMSEERDERSVTLL